MDSAANTSPLEGEVTVLDGLALSELRKRWSRLFQCPVPKGFSRDLLVRGIAFKLQEKALGCGDNLVI